MSGHDDLTLLFTGSEIDAKVLKEILEDNQIASLIKNDQNSGLAAGFGGGLQGLEAHVYVTNDDLEKAKTLLDKFLKSFDNK